MKNVLLLTATALLASGALRAADAPAPAPAPANSAVSASAASVVPAPPNVPTTGYILMDYDSGRVLASMRADDRMEPASITKLMTAYIVFAAIKEKRLTMNEEVGVSVY